MCGHLPKEECYQDNSEQQNITHYTHQLDTALPSQGTTRDSSLFEHMQLPLTLKGDTHMYSMDSRSLDSLWISCTLSGETMGTVEM